MQKGQLGHGDQLQRNVPTIVDGLTGMRIIGGRCLCNILPCRATVLTPCAVGTGAGGKHHSAVVTSDGDSYTFGSNLHGQCGTGSIKSKDKIEGKNPVLLTNSAIVL